MAGKWILVPYNFTDYDERALHYVIRTFADQKVVHVSLLHAYTPLPELDGYSHASLGRLKTTMASMWTEIRVFVCNFYAKSEDILYCLTRLIHC